MPSPFPGMDPYLESQGYWEDFHTSSLTYCRRVLTSVLPKHYGAFIEQRIALVDFSSESHLYKPDVPIIQKDRGTESQRDRSAVATLEPITIPLALEALEEVRERWIEIKKLPSRSLVTVIELLSPTNKVGSGRTEYIEKRNQWIKQPVNLVEINLLLGGHRLPMRGRLPRADYFAFVSRAGRRPNSDVFAWSIRRPLPIIPIPLLDPDPDVLLDLAAVFAQTYDDAPYGDSIDYSARLEVPLSPEDRAWAEQLARAREIEPRTES
ncbi:MAG: DUF4058 family protein [Isosphaeraceae bacterium]